MSKRDIVLHTCCAPCAGWCVQKLIEDNWRVILYYSNDNLCSQEEFCRRLDSVKILAEHFDTDLEVDPYDNASWMSDICGLEDEPERGKRCEKCFRHSLSRTSAFAEKFQAAFTTSLTVSPYKSSDLIFSTGKSLGNFAEYNFKKQNGYLNSTRIATELGFYRQNFCGCIMSARRAYEKKSTENDSASE